MGLKTSQFTLTVILNHVKAFKKLKKEEMYTLLIFTVIVITKKFVNCLEY